MAMKVACVFFLHGLLVTAFPANDGVDPGLMGVPVTGVAEFSGTSPATGSVTIVGLAPYTDILPAPTQNVILGASLAETIISEAGKDIDAKLAEIDAYVNKELKEMAPQIQTALENAVISNIDTSLDTTIHEMESQISTELSKFDQFIESELAKTEQLVQTVLRNVESETSSLDNEISHTVTKKLTEQEALMQLVMLILQSFVESKLKQTEAVVKNELEKVNTFVETELDKVDTIIESDTAKIDSIIETELEKSDAFLKSEVAAMEYLVESKHERMESLVKSESDNVKAFVESELMKTNDLVNSELSRIETLVESGLGKVDGALEEIDDSCQMISNAVPVTGEAFIIGNTDCPPIYPTMDPLLVHLQSFSPLDDEDYESYAPILPSIDTGYTPPTVGVAESFVALNQAPCSQYYGYDMQNAEPVLYHKKRLPFVNIIGGTVRATGRINLFANFPCPPLTATEIGPDGKKYIWISKKSADKEADTKLLESSSEESSNSQSSSEESKSEENSVEDLNGDLDVDFRVPGPIPVCGVAVFEGTTPAHGSVSIQGHGV